MSSDSFRHHGFPEEDLREGGHHNPGYFRVWLGMQLENGRYCIVRKLGWGCSSTVWLVRDSKLARFATIKIMTREATTTIQAGKSNEITMLQEIAAADRAHRGSRHLVQYYDTFQITRPDGLHSCVVMETLGLSLDNLRCQAGPECLLPLGIIKSAMRQVLLGLDYLHTLCGIVHTDLKFDNIIFRFPDMSAIITRNIVEHPSRTYKAIMRAQPMPYMIESQPIHINLAHLQPNELEIAIADFGHSHWLHHHTKEEVQPAGLRAPEVILGYPWNQAVDIWSVGCLVAELLSGSPLFMLAIFSKVWSMDEDHLAQMTDVVGEGFPGDMLDKSRHRSKYFKEDGSFIHSAIPRTPNWPLRRCLAEEPSSIRNDEQEVDAAVHFLRRCLRLQPESRATAKELAEDPWLNQ